MGGGNKTAAEHQLTMAAQFCECPENHSVAYFVRVSLDDRPGDVKCPSKAHA